MKMAMILVEFATESHVSRAAFMVLVGETALP